MNAKLIHKWLRNPRFAPEEEAGSALDIDDAALLPVEIEDQPSALGEQIASPVIGVPLSAQRVDITLSDGRRVLIEGTTALSAVLSLVERLMLCSRCRQTRGFGWLLG